jgi:ABC-2 type transport system permease protein
VIGGHADATPGGPRLFEVFRQEFSHQLRRPLFWVQVLLLGFFAFSMSNGQASIQSGDARVGGTKAWIDSEFAVTQLLILLTGVLYSFFISVGAGMALIRDGELKVGELLHATRLTPGEYVWGKFLAQLAGSVAVLTLHLALTAAFNHLLPHGANRDSIGPFALMNYVRPALVFALPMLVCMTGVSLAVGGLTRKPVLVFVLPVAVILFGAMFLWDWSPSWLAQGWNRALQFVDLTGQRWIRETWLAVDRGVDFYNHRPVGLDALIIVQRLMCVAIGLGSVALLQARFAALLRGSAAAPRAGAAESAAVAAAPTSPAPLSALGMRSGAPGLWTGALEVARVEWQELWKHPGLYLFVPMILLQVFGSVVEVGAFDTPALATPGLLAVRQMNTLTLLVCMLLLFYTTEALQREASTGLGSIHSATPLRTPSLLLGKCLANTFLALVVLVMTLLGCAIVLAVQGRVSFDLRPFALVWGLLLIPTFVLWTAFVCAGFAITGNRVGSYVLGLAAMALTGFAQARGWMTWAYNWDLWGSTPWSDISVLELDRTALVLNRVLALGLAALLLAITVRLMRRRDADATRLVHRLSPRALGRGALALAPYAVVPLAAFVALVFLVHEGRGGAVARKEMRDYWKRNIQTWRDAKSPVLAAADVDVTLDPAHGRVATRGVYTLVNRTDDTLRQVAVTGGRWWTHVRWTLDGDSTKPEDRARLYVFTPRVPLPPGGRVRVGYAFDGQFPAGVSRNGGGLMEFVLPSGAVLTGFSDVALGPFIGYRPEIGVEKDKNDSDPRDYPADYWHRELPGMMPMFDGWADTHIRVTSPAAFQHNATGVMVAERVTGAERTTEWRSDAPVRAFNVVIGKWKVKRGDGVAVYYDARHTYNVDEMVAALADARKWYGTWFAPYPWKDLRLSEFAGLATYAQGSPTNITFSENIGFLTRSEPKADAAYWITAHEAAHQWWPGIAMPGDGPGGDVLSEGLAHFSTILLVGQTRGEEQRRACCRQIEDHYGNTRRRDSERPLNRVDGGLPGDARIIYDRGGWTLWMLHELMGRDSSLAGLREYLSLYRDSRDHPLVEDYLVVMRRHARDTLAFDAYARQWILGTVVPHFLVTDAAVTHEGGGWQVRARVRNVGTGTVAVEVAATRGERFPKRRTPGNAWADARATVTLGAGEEKPVVIRCAFEPRKVVVDPDVRVLMLERQKAERPL